MEIIRYVSLLILFALFGIFYVQFLTIHPLRMSRSLLAATAAFIAGLGVLAFGFRGWQIWLAAGLAVLSALGSYLWMARQVMSRDDTRSLPKLVRRADDPGKGHTAVIYFTHGEPETYDPIGWINQFREFDAQKIPFVPLVARPFFLNNLRKKYLQVGRSEHRSIHHKMIHSLEQAYRNDGDQSTRFYLSFLDDNPRPDAATIQALNDGASRLVVAEVFLTDSNHTAEGKDKIQEVLAKFPALPVRFSGPLQDSQTLQRMFVQRAALHMGDIDKEMIGVLLVGHGQPDEWDREWPTETAQEISFRLDVLRHFEAAGYKRENMSLAWMEFKQPKPAKKIEEFVANGVEKVLYFPAAISADSLHSQYDIPELVEKARVPAGFPLVNLGAWNDDPMVIRAIKEKIYGAMCQF
ncbi:MAG TPA: ferrochelatase [Anaerolineales bacterium]|nr:ferrochelatase [Anaerolineales bacterium]